MTGGPEGGLGPAYTQIHEFNLWTNFLSMYKDARGTYIASTRLLVPLGMIHSQLRDLLFTSLRILVLTFWLSYSNQREETLIDCSLQMSLMIGKVGIRGGSAHLLMIYGATPSPNSTYFTDSLNDRHIAREVKRNLLRAILLLLFLL